MLRSTRARSRCDAAWRVIVAAAALIVPQPAYAGSIMIGPYLQDLGADRATIKLELAAPAPAKLVISGPDGFRREVSAGARSLHALVVDGLRPATAYEYRVTVGGDEQAGRFTTAPADGRPFTFLIYGDSRSDVGAHQAVIRALSGVAADFLVNTGDMVFEGDATPDWRDFFQVEGALLRDRCVFACVGNHELTMAGRGGDIPFLRYFAPPHEGGPAELYGTFRWSNTRFFLLNAMDQWTGPERAWLEAELGRAKDEPGIAHRVVVMHQGPWSSGPHGGNPRLADGQVVRIMRSGNVDLILAGHDHVYERGEGDGLKYVISGGAGAPLYPKRQQAAQTLYFESVHHFVTASIDGDLVKIVARRATGSVIEACGFRGGGPWQCEGAAEPAASAKAPPSAPPRTVTACGCSLPGVGGGEASLGVPLGAAAVIALARRRRRRAASS